MADGGFNFIDLASQSQGTEQNGRTSENDTELISDTADLVVLDNDENARKPSTKNSIPPKPAFLLDQVEDSDDISLRRSLPGT